jgi:hypothetical protein
MRWGTAYFRTIADAINYYGKEAASYKLKNGEIFTGQPELKQGEKLLIDEDGRYHIEDNKK